MNYFQNQNNSSVFDSSLGQNASLWFAVINSDSIYLIPQLEHVAHSWWMLLDPTDCLMAKCNPDRKYKLQSIQKESTGDVHNVACSIWCHYLNCYFSSTIYFAAPASRINGNFTCQIWHKRGQATSLAEQCFQYDFFLFSTQCQIVEQFKSRNLSKITSSCWSFICLNKQMIYRMVARISSL